MNTRRFILDGRKLGARKRVAASGRQTPLDNVPTHSCPLCLGRNLELACLQDTNEMFSMVLADQVNIS